MWGVWSASQPRGCRRGLGGEECAQPPNLGVAGGDLSGGSTLSPPHSPFWVSFVEHTRVATWKESLLMVQLPRLCMLLPVAEWPFSSSSAFVDGRLRYVAASSSFLASAWVRRTT